MRAFCLSLILGFALVLPLAAADPPEWRAGTEHVDITPSGPIWLGGYAARDHPSEGVLHPIGAKALVFEDRDGTRVAIITMDLIGIGRGLSDDVCQRIFQRTGIPRERIVLNVSHTHSGPVVAGVTPLVYDLTPEQQAAVDDYAKALADKLVTLAETAIKDLRPARLAFGEGKATFGANRRATRLKVPPDSPKAPVDHGVPVLAVRDETDSLQAVLFGYACHSTTLSVYEVNGDYPGFALTALETAHPGATALFMAGCGADVNPDPRREVALAKQYGQALATAVDEVLGGSMRPVHGPLSVGFERIDLKLVDAPTQQQIEQLLQDKNKYQQRLARHLLDELAAGRTLPTSYPCPVQVIRFGNDLVMAALAGEPCVDYALRLRRELADRPIWIAGYCNDIFAYIPSERVLQEGGYEGGEAMVYFGLHGPFQPGLEQQIIDAVKRLAK